MRLAERVERIGESATMMVTRRAEELNSSGVRVISFGAGEPDFDSPPAAVRAAQSALRQGFTKYTPCSGTADLRSALAARYRDRHQAPWSESEVLITVGAKAALLELALALFEPGHRVVVPTPCWVSFPEQLRLAGATPVLVPMRREEGFVLRADAMLAALDGEGAASTAVRAAPGRGVILNSPCNPTGSMISASELRRLVEGCAERGAVLIADETYERFTYDGSEHCSAAALATEFPETVVVVSSFSKSYAMTGWRVGYLLGPPPLVEAAARVQSHATSNATSFAMAGALAALSGAEAEVAAMVAEFEARRDLLVAGLERLPGVECLPPAGAFYVFAHVAAHYSGRRQGSVAFAESLLDEARVAVVPGAAFGNDEHVRLSFACSRDTIAEGLERLHRALGD